MDSQLVIPVESLDSARGALTAAARIATASGAGLRLVHVRVWDRPTPQGGGRFYPKSSEDATTALDDAMQFVWSLGAQASGIVLDAHRSAVATAVLDEAAASDAEVIVVPAPSRSVLSQGVWDKATRQLARRSPRPVMLVSGG